MFSFPTALIFGIWGIIHDRRQWLAIVVTLIAGSIMVMWACKI
jgi:hypothetical protein